MCDKSFENKYKLRTHNISHKQKEKFECLICGVEYAKYKPLHGHIERVHPKQKTEITLCCHLCNEKFYLNQPLEQHKKNKHAPLNKRKRQH